jgi:ribosomal protein S18 acetylase RimI-like enzyme
MGASELNLRPPEKRYVRAMDDAMTVRPFRRSDGEAVIRLWAEGGLLKPWNDPGKDIERKLTTQPELFLVGEHCGEVVATVMAGFDGHRGWIYYLAVAPEHRHKSFGRQVVTEAERRLLELNCPKVNLMVRTGNEQVIEFYRRLGYTRDEVINLGKRLVED